MAPAPAKGAKPGARYTTRAGADDAEFTPLGALQYLLGIPGPSGFGSRSTAGQLAAKWDGSGKVAIVTGSSGGLGAETARALAARGCHVVLAARDVPKASRVAAAIRAAHPAASVEPMELDLSSLASVRAFASAFARKRRALHLLVANAGTVFAPLSMSKDGYESAFATNHLGHYLLVELLKPLLIESARAAGAPSRVVVLSSEGHRHPPTPEDGGPIRFERLNDPKGYSKLAAYAQSKLCNLLFCRELQRRADAAGEPLLCLAVHPGVVGTDADRHVPLPGLLKRLLKLLVRPYIKGVPQGAATTVYAATAPIGAPGISGGEYLADCNPHTASTLSHDAELGRTLWEFSERAVARHA
ncbi:hypothetical protein Rsub_08653 [Raphidocelis subcapitata]|uniref:Uncharacterized protein n=1 Tax=Raphidocelis subcapitata TaxID=307507 RepID=A0A2V0P723_9CHLO|nr:hypothetical protein Rsub_08653 [Raphidocelis subcapitata]|eukprot:GBF95671.1 hypothetical protein Rsub_08653 [Raphidocelis subcapitata]